MELGNEATPTPEPRLPWGTCGAAHPVVNILNIRTSHPVAPALECSDVRLVGQEARERVLELRCPVTQGGEVRRRRLACAR